MPSQIDISRPTVEPAYEGYESCEGNEGVDGDRAMRAMRAMRVEWRAIATHQQSITQIQYY